MKNNNLSYYYKQSDSTPIKTINMLAVDFIVDVDVNLKEELRVMNLPENHLIQIKDKSSNRNFCLLPETQKDYEDWNLHLVFSNNLEDF